MVGAVEDRDRATGHLDVDAACVGDPPRAEEAVPADHGQPRHHVVLVRSPNADANSASTAINVTVCERCVAAAAPRP